jgi:release factor H-coupled RctB family protein
MVTIITSKKNWIEGEAVQQLEQSARLPGMQEVVGLPDLHPGKGYPIGAAFACRERIYPYLIGNDIGCGMALWQTELKKKKIKLDRWTKRLVSLDKPWDGNRHDLSELSPCSFDKSLGTIGCGNHFVELQMVEKIINPEIFHTFNLNKNYLFLLVHSGSRGLGESILRQHIDKHKADGLAVNSKEAVEYLKKHNHAVQWAEANREIISRNFLDTLGSSGKKISDLPHNLVSKEIIGSDEILLHRKGAVPADKGLVVIPGSRGAMTYLVKPVGDLSKCLYSLAHGAGRKWRRGDTRKRLSSKYKPKDLLQTEFGSRVICGDKQLLYEEAPQAYKNISTVIQALVDAELISVIAILRPVITYKKV